MASPASANVDARAAIIIDATTGQVIYSQNANKKMPVASISKLLTMAVVHDELQKGTITPNTKVKVTKAVAAVSNDPNYSAIGLVNGHQYTINSLIRAAMIKSADGATLALALAGNKDLSHFNAKMIKKGHQIGMKDFKVVNPVGLTNEQLKGLAIKGIAKTAENEMTATDVALLGRYLVRTYPALLKVTSQSKASFVIKKGQTKTVNNLNKMLPGGSYTVPGVTINGLKTGTSDKAGACFVSSGQYQGHQIITVILHANGGSDDRFKQTQQLYQLLKSNYHLQTIKVPQNVSRQAVANGKQRTVKLQPTRVSVWMSRGQLKNYTVGTSFNRRLVNKKGQLQAPVKKGQQVGKLTLTSKGIRAVDGGPLTYRLVSQQTVSRGGWLSRLLH